jgi:hypothetical protein
MFLRLAQELIRIYNLGKDKEAEAANIVFRYRPVDLLSYLEDFWAVEPGKSRKYANDDTWRRVLAEPFTVGSDPYSENLPRPAYPAPKFTLPEITNYPQDQGVNILPVWKHLIYAYTIENTRVLDILRRVVYEILVGEHLGRPSECVLSWARNTEELFFTDRIGHWIFSQTSRLRNDAGAIRRNAYYRLLGMDLNHGSEDGSPYPFPKPATANREFSRTFEQLLSETWRGYVNRKNTIGPNLTDEVSLINLVLSIRDMLHDRRINGVLAREEFFSVATLSWFHLTVNNDNEVVVWLNAQGNNAAERLRLIGERVNMRPHKNAYDFFEMAEPLSEIISRIETDLFGPGNVTKLYDGTDPTTSIMLEIINHWSVASGRNLKEFIGAPVQTRL